MVTRKVTISEECLKDIMAIIKKWPKSILNWLSVLGIIQKMKTGRRIKNLDIARMTNNLQCVSIVYNKTVEAHFLFS